MTVEEAKKEVQNYISPNGIGFPNVKEAIKILLARLDELEQDLDGEKNLVNQIIEYLNNREKLADDEWVSFEIKEIQKYIQDKIKGDQAEG